MLSEKGGGKGLGEYNKGVNLVKYAVHIPGNITVKPRI
jgi:hypothetical protein